MSDNTITEQLRKVASDVLSEEVLQEIETAFNESVSNKADELAALRVEKALVEQDEAHAIKLERLLEAIDSDHTSKLHKVVESLDRIHSDKLIQIVKKFKNDMNGDANMFKESLIDNISNYLDLYVEKDVPTKDIREAVKNRHAVTILEGLRKNLSIDSALASDHVRDAVIDGKRQIDEASAVNSKLTEENRVLRESINKKEANLALERLTEGLPSSKKRHIYKVLDGKSVKFIKENYQYTLVMFEKTEADKMTELKQQATQSKKIADRPVQGKKHVVSESVEQQIEQTNPDSMQDRGLFDNYMGELTRW